MNQPKYIELAAEVVASAIIQRLALPDNLRGCTVTMPDFSDGETCAHFYEGRTLGFHQAINTLLAQEVRSRGGTASKIVITQASSANETEETRCAFADRHYSVMGRPQFPH